MLRWFKRLMLWLAALVGLAALALGGLYYYSQQTLAFDPTPANYDLKLGSNLRIAAQELTAIGVLREPYLFEVLGRALLAAPHLKAGNYEFESPTTPLKLLQKMTQGDVTQSGIRFIDGWTFKQVRQALDTNKALVHETIELSNEEIARRLGISSSIPNAIPEGWIFPDTYYFSRGTSDLAVLRRAYRLMQKQLNAQWTKKAANLPLASPYEALILASIIEKETGKGSDRAMVSSVFVNRLRLGMRLQTDPTVIYGMGEAFDGNLRRRDLQTDSDWNTYTRAGLPPTPIAMPGLASIQAALNPAESEMLYFVARGDGTSQFSRTLDEHNAAVNKYQRSGRK
jgi:UPF0755 protein